MKLPAKIFVAGTDTGVGKSVVAAMLVAGLAARYWKPVQSGLLEATDSQIVQDFSGVAGVDILAEGYTLNQPLSPHASAALDGINIDLQKLNLPVTDDRPLIVEGAGGVLVPLNDESLIIDLIEKLSLPVLIVARSGLGTINHTLMTLEVLRQRNIDIIGVVMNGEANVGNQQAITQYGKVEVVALDWLPQVDRKQLLIQYGKLFS